MPPAKLPLLGSLAASIGLAIAACSSPAPAPAPATSAEAGANAYARTCALCHGAHGEGYLADNATALKSPTFLATASDDYLRQSVARGRPGTTMSAWDRPHGGPYSNAEIQGIVAFMRRWQTVPNAPLGGPGISGDLTRARPIYDAHCASCHGATGTEGPNVRLGNAEFLAIAKDEFLRYAILHGRPGTTMGGYEAVLGAQDVDDVVALLRSWAKPIVIGDAPIPGTMGPVILNPGGPDPDFVLGNRYTPADTIKKELDRGASFGFLDARAPSDFVAGHVAGANDVPFYEASNYLFALPKDKWLVCYCGCPHAESGSLADTLYANGFTKVTVLDEGYYVWRDRGYPVRVGVSP